MNRGSSLWGMVFDGLQPLKLVTTKIFAKGLGCMGVYLGGNNDGEIKHTIFFCEFLAAILRFGVFSHESSNKKQPFPNKCVRIVVFPGCIFSTCDFDHLRFWINTTKTGRHTPQAPLPLPTRLYFFAGIPFIVGELPGGFPHGVRCARPSRGHGPAALQEVRGLWFQADQSLVRVSSQPRWAPWRNGTKPVVG